MEHQLSQSYFATWLETEFDCRFRLRFSLLIQLILSKCVLLLLLVPPQSIAQSPAVARCGVWSWLFQRYLIAQDGLVE